MTTVGVLGGGPWGAAIARAARRAGQDVLLCTRRQQPSEYEGIAVTTQLDELAQTRLIIVAVPSHMVRAIARELGDHVDGSHLIVHGIRGLSGPELMTISEILRQETPVRRVGALGGPIQADELAQGRASAIMVGSEYGEVTRAVKQALASDWLRVYTTPDRAGLEWGSAIVGCLSVGIGYAQQADSTAGLLAALVSEGLEEAAQIAAHLGAEPSTLYGLAGFGDLLASMALRDRPEVVLGRALARGDSLEQAQQEAKLRIEAVELVPRIVRFAEHKRIRCQMFSALGWILEGVPADEIVGRLFAAGSP